MSRSRKPVLDELVDALAGKPAAGEVATDRWQTPPDVVELLDALWPDGIDLDPFGDPSPHCVVKARASFDIRRGEDAYALTWADALAPSCNGSIFANGPYSADNPARTMRAIALHLRTAGRYTEVANLCPAAPGSNYWRRFAWPWANAIAWMGRTAFVAGVDIVKNGRTVARAGDRVHGNRTELALVYNGPRVSTFERLLQGAGYPVVTLT